MIHYLPLRIIWLYIAFNLDSNINFQLPHFNTRDIKTYMTEDALSKHAKAVAKSVVPHVAAPVAAPAPVTPAASQTPETPAPVAATESSEAKN